MTHGITQNKGSFNKLRLYADVDVNCVISTKNIGSIHCELSETEFQDRYFIKNDNGILTIHANGNYLTDYASSSPITVYTDSISHIENGQNGTIRVKEGIVNESFCAISSGNGKIIIDSIYCNRIQLKIITGKGDIDITNGTCESAYLKLIGVGNINILNIPIKHIKCHFMGGGKIYCHSLESLSAIGIGSTKIYYYGHPRITGIGRKRCRIINSENDKGN